jgi:hypothetical protein
MVCKRASGQQMPLEKYLFAYLSDQHPRSRVIQKASQLISAVRHFRKSDALVEWFARTLKHQSEESDYSVMTNRADEVLKTLKTGTVITSKGYVGLTSLIKIAADLFPNF